MLTYAGACAASAYVSSEAKSVAVVPDASPQLRDLQVRLIKKKLGKLVVK